MPRDARHVDVAEQARLDDAVVGGLVHRVVVALVADLEDAADSSSAACRMLQQPATSHAIIFSQSTCLPAARHADGDVGVRPQRDGDDDRLDVLVADHVLPLGVVFRRRAPTPQVPPPLPVQVQVTPLKFAGKLSTRVALVTAFGPSL